MSEIVNQLEDSWDAWLQAGGKEAVADHAAGHAGGGAANPAQDDWAAAHTSAHHEADLFTSQHEHDSADQVAEADIRGFGTVMQIDNMTTEGLPTAYY